MNQLNNEIEYAEPARFPDTKHTTAPRRIARRLCAPVGSVRTIIATKIRPQMRPNATRKYRNATSKIRRSNLKKPPKRPNWSHWSHFLIPQRAIYFYFFSASLLEAGNPRQAASFLGRLLPSRSRWKRTRLEYPRAFVLSTLRSVATRSELDNRAVGLIERRIAGLAHGLYKVFMQHSIMKRYTPICLSVIYLMAPSRVHPARCQDQTPATPLSPSKQVGAPKTPGKVYGVYYLPFKNIYITSVSSTDIKLMSRPHFLSEEDLRALYAILRRKGGPPLPGIDVYMLIERNPIGDRTLVIGGRGKVKMGTHEYQLKPEDFMALKEFCKQKFPPRKPQPDKKDTKTEP